MIAQAQAFGVMEGLAITLSVVSLIITVVGFFASLKFYRDGVELQRAANEALTKLEEKIGFIQTQVGGMFDKTLEAAIGKFEIVCFCDIPIEALSIHCTKYGHSAWHYQKSFLSPRELLRSCIFR